mmetsp:Transcript_32266/g.64023  ORF Transcript_32266/g.64023 Transcript_32266/m.64023 type:complete len:105 (+) Transcript_32266:735-1049(+)
MWDHVCVHAVEWNGENKKLCFLPPRPTKKRLPSSTFSFHYSKSYFSPRVTSRILPIRLELVRMLVPWSWSSFRLWLSTFWMDSYPFAVTATRIDDTATPFLPFR